MKSKRSSSQKSFNKKQHQHQHPSSSSLSTHQEDSLTSSNADLYTFLDPFAPGTPFPPVLDEAEWSKAPAIDVLDRLAPPVLFFTPQVAEEYVNRFCQRGAPEAVISFEGFPAREIPVMRRLTTMMAGILSKAAESAAKSNMSSSRPRNPHFQQHLNTSVFNLFSTLSASATEARQRRKLQVAQQHAHALKVKEMAALEEKKPLSMKEEIELLQREIEKDAAAARE
jgi:hypothetical protein